MAGNVRRSAQIAIGDHDDIEYLQQSAGILEVSQTGRAMSNNSVACDDISLLPEEFWEGYKGNGEPYGLINLESSRRMGRTGDTKYPDPATSWGTIRARSRSLAPFETLLLGGNLSPEHREVERELKDVATSSIVSISIASLSSVRFPKLRISFTRTCEWVSGATGYLQATEEQRSWLSSVYTPRAYDQSTLEFADFQHLFKLTTVKPSGTLSLLAGVTPGAHPGYSQYYIRRIRMATDSELVSVYETTWVSRRVREKLGRHGGSLNRGCKLPCSFPEGTTFAHDMTAVDQLNVIKRLQAEWSDNSVSVTIYYRRELDLSRVAR